MAERLEAGPEDRGMRLDAFLARRLGLSRSRAAELVAGGAVTVGGEVVAKSYRLVPGERVEVALEAGGGSGRPLPEVRVVYEDEHLVVVDKQAGVVVHPAAGLREGTLVEALAASGRPLAPAGGGQRPGVVHRLDRDVSGLLVVAKTDAAHRRLVAALAAREVRREYLAGVAGVPSVDAGKIEAPVGRSPRHPGRMALRAEGKPAVTWFRVRERFAEASLLEVRLETGRTHQIRTHLASVGHPVLGDAAYGRDPALARRVGLRRPFLHAFRLAFSHPLSGQAVELESPLPADLEAALAALRSGGGATAGG